MKRENMIKIGWNFDNSYIHLPKKLYSEQGPSPVKDAKLVILNKELAESLGLDPRALESQKGVEVFAGNIFPPGTTPIAQAYAGHQFGYFTMLGDGRALLLGEHISPKGERFDIQLKGSGKTKYSRGGDGRAALGPMLREYIISEAMYKLGVPTSRSLAVVTTGEHILRQGLLPGAILTRLASSHIRVGTFEYIAKYGNNEELKLLTEYTIQRHFPHIASDENRYLKFLKEVIKKQADLIAKWQHLGFIHGVMNTDNMTISGESIDFGPCAFMDTFSMSRVFSSIDTRGRYAYGNQPQIGGWNLARLAESLLPLFHNDEDRAVEMATKEVSEFFTIFDKFYLDGMRRKLGLFDERPEDEDLIEDLLKLMEKLKADYTNTFRSLTLNKFNDIDLFATEEFAQWKGRWEDRLANENKSRQEVKDLMKNNNPSIIPRNHRVEEALSAAEKGDYGVMEKLLKVLKDPYAYTKDQEDYTKLPEESSIPYRTFCGT